MNHSIFTRRLLGWFKTHGRTTLPWQNTGDPYRIWVAEIMLQQTQVDTVIPYYKRFLKRFPDIKRLASATIDEVMAHWAGLGYYARARNLHRAAGIVVARHNGTFPTTFAEVLALPGIGRSTAGAVLVFAHDQRHAILDGNVKRVLARVFGISGYPGQSRVAATLWDLATGLTPATDTAAYTQAIMDFGATLCTRANPHCTKCPFRAECVAHTTANIAAYPGTKPGKPRPVRATTMLVLLSEAGQVLLERRPPSGLWGGLYSLPEVDATETDTAAFCRQAFGVELRTNHQRPVIKHSFTHFDLLITPLVCDVTALADRVADDTLQWFQVGAQTLPGLPAVVAKILQQVGTAAK